MKLLSKQEKWAGKRRKRCLRVPTASGVLNAGVLWQAGNAKKWNSSCVKSENESVTECCKYVGIVCPVSACVPESGAVVWMSSARGMLVLQHSLSGARPGHCAGQHLASSVNSLDDVFSVSMPDCWRLTAFLLRSVSASVVQCIPSVCVTESQMEAVILSHMYAMTAHGQSFRYGGRRMCKYSLRALNCCKHPYLDLRDVKRSWCEDVCSTHLFFKPSVHNQEQSVLKKEELKLLLSDSGWAKQLHQGSV